MSTLDPRHRNVVFEGPLKDVLGVYADKLRLALLSVDVAQLEKAVSAVEAASQAGKAILVIGNGGSSAIGEHLCCDWTKGTDHVDHPPLKTQNLSSNSALLTALANDFGYHESFSRQVGYFGTHGDILVAISSSGNSENIMNAVRLAQAAGMVVIGLSGFSGGQLRQQSPISLHVDVHNYGLVEDAHQALMHIMAQYIFRKRERSE